MVVIKYYIKTVISIILMILLAIGSQMLPGNQKYMLIALIAALLTCIPFFTLFETKEYTSREVVLIAVMIALSVAGRFLFAILPHFKPVTVLIIITGIHFGANAGFITGSLTALFSNMTYGQGPWTVFQMAVWGLIGFFAGIIAKKGLLKNKAVLIIFSAFCGVIYSLVMDIYTTLSLDTGFSFEKYLFYVTFSIPVMIEYIISNIIFMLLLEQPIGKKLKRIKLKYGVFCKKDEQ